MFQIDLRRLRALLGAGALVVGILFAQGASPAQAVSQVFTFSGGPQTFQVPVGDCSATVHALGAQGGGAGGPGGQADATFSVTPGETLQVNVGGMGFIGGGGFNGGANGGPSTLPAGPGGGGGGASDVRRGSQPIIVAGGGGGGGSGPNPAPGGQGGGAFGTPGLPGPGPGGGQGGGGATSGGPGSAGAGGPGSLGSNPGNPGTTGGQGVGGPGGAGAPASGFPFFTPPGGGGGGGGGGFFGGGGGGGGASGSAGGGGGGGSGFVFSGASSFLLQPGVNGGNGSVTLTTFPCPKSSPTLTTRATTTATLGGTISDTATLTGGNNPTGSITFSVFGPNNGTCSGTASTSTKVVTGNGNYTSDPFTPAAAGTYRWVASYSGDVNNNSATTACNDAGETSTVTAKSSPTLTTQATPSATLGGTISDTATLSGGSAPTGSITFKVFGPNDTTCTTTPAFTSTKTVNGNGSYPSDPFTPATAGSYRWVASYSGDTNNNSATTACNDANETSTVTAAPSCQEADGNGDFQGDHGNGNFQMDDDNCEESGHGGNGESDQGDRIDSSNRGDGKDFHSNKIESTKFDSGAHTVTITGQGTSAGKPVTFTLVALETGAGSPGRVSLTLSDGFKDAGDLLNGSITLH